MREEKPTTPTPQVPARDHRRPARSEGGDGPAEERSKRHKGQVGGQVWIPEMWGHESFLKEWIDSAAFDAALAPKGIASARAALVEEGRRRRSGRVRVESSC